MITNLDATIALSSLGWVDHGSILRFDAETTEVSTVDMSDANHLALKPGRADTFSAVHHFDGRLLMVTVQTFRQPDQPLATIEVRDWSPRLAGDPHAWDYVSSAYVGYLNDDATGASGYFLLRIQDGAASLTRVDWFGDEYDHGYQSVTAVDVVPETGDLIFGVQRSSELVLCDGRTEQVKRKISLADRYGNPMPCLLEHTPEAWAIDYDTVVRLDRRTWTKTGEMLAQPADAGTQGFVGEAYFAKDETTVLIPRPFSADVVHVDTRTLRPIATTRTGGQPLTTALLATGDVIARDWKTGHLLPGTSSDPG